jgi:hypothetical protein
MTQDELNQDRLACACVAIGKVLHELLQEQKIDAQEFLSLIGYLPVKLADLDAEKWGLK